MGNKPTPRHSVDRIDVNGDYEPGNCRWATPSEQAWNKRNNKLEPQEPDQIRWMHSDGCRQIDIARFFGISKSYVSQLVRS